MWWMLIDDLCICIRVYVSSCVSMNSTLTHWGRDKMAAIFQTTFSNGFSWMKMFEFRLKCHWSLFQMVKLTIFQSWFRKWLGADEATSHYLNQWWLVYWRIYAPLGLNELRIPCFLVWYKCTVVIMVVLEHNNDFCIWISVLLCFIFSTLNSFQAHFTMT